MSRPQASRPTYSPEQIDEYLKYISFPPQERCPPASINTEQGRLYLDKLIKYQLAHVPFENLELHYSTHHAISLDTDYLFHKIVEQTFGRGGYCMQNNLFFGTILRSIGFNVMPVGARVSSAAGATNGEAVDTATYSGFSHTVNIITIQGKKYFCDVGFGSRGPTALVALKDGLEGRNSGNDQGGTLYRLSRGHILDNTHSTSEQLLWEYGVRFHESMPYLPVYCFTEIEFLPQDFQVMSFYVSQSPTSWFTHQILCQKFILNEAGEIIGDITLDGTSFKERQYGKGEDLCNATSEDERVDALRKYFGITLSKSEINGIKGMITMIK